MATSTRRKSSNIVVKKVRKGRISKKKNPKRSSKLSQLRKLEGMSLEVCQTNLRRQFGREQNFELENVGEHPFSPSFTSPTQSPRTFTTWPSEDSS